MQMAVEFVYEGEALLRLSNLLEDTLAPSLVILRNALMRFAFVIFALLANSYHGWTLILL
jgi:hypothetical protein